MASRSQQVRNRNPARKHMTRRANPPLSFSQKHGISSDPPPADSLFWKMWNSSLPTAQQALNTDFIQGIKHGNLSPPVYGSKFVRDAYYCLRGAADYEIAYEKAVDEELKGFLQHKLESYNELNEDTAKTWGLSSADGITPNDAIKAYADLEHNVVTTMPPIYTLIVMLPCEYLWYWLSEQMRDNTKDNLYTFWIDGNDSPNGSYTMGNYIDAYMKAHPGVVNEAEALSVFQAAMEGERNFFES